MTAKQQRNQGTQQWHNAILSKTANLQQAIANLDAVAIQIILVLDKYGRLEGTVSDGDIRRGLLRGLSLEHPIESILHKDPLVVPDGLERHFVLQLMSANKIRQIPIIDADQRVIGLHLWDQLSHQEQRPNSMIIMAGGKGTRLHPYTESCPKPMLEVAGKPMLEHIIERAKLEGFYHFILAIHYLGEIIETYFGDGSSFDVHIDYLREEAPLGTAGALSLLSQIPDQPCIVTNGDVITDIRYGELLDFHDRQHAAATMAVRIHEWQNPFGVVKMQGFNITGFEEKPCVRTHINAGIYALSPTALHTLDTGKYCDMPTLFERLYASSHKTVAYPMHEPWLDVGRPDDLIKANQQHATQ
ncbi:MAG: nucleotidyltransferase family protein [bacterium]